MISFLEAINEKADMDAPSSNAILCATLPQVVFACLFLTFGCDDASSSDLRDEAGDGDGSDSTGGNESVENGAGGSNSGGYGGDGGAPVSGGMGGTLPGDDLVPAFVAQGHLGRTVVSCDDGQTWNHDQSNEVGDGTCWSGEIGRASV